MATISLLSSSPPRPFAHSPTPAASSPSLPSPSAFLRDASAGPLRFKAADKTRDRFSNGFTSARSMLQPKMGAENVSLGSPGRTRFKQLDKKSSIDPSLTTQTSTSVCCGLFPQPSPSKHFVDRDSIDVETGKTTQPSEKRVNIDPQTISTAQLSTILSDEPDVHSSSRSQQMAKVIPRKSDWTPVKPTIEELEGAQNRSITFSENLLQSFAFQGCARDGKSEGDVVTGVSTKRRRIELVQTTNPQSTISLPIVKIGAPSKPEKAATKKRNKSPAKKPLTITGLATTNYGEEYLNQGKVSPMVQFLTSTQVGATEGDPPNEGTTKRATKPKAGSKKNRVSKKIPPKSRLVSPTSAMKSLIDQDTIFGSASQLAREESPTLIRDTIEATKQSELILSSDSISPQKSQALSIGTISPQIRKGTSRFVKRRNLWGAAGRDEDNALLHVDTIDLSDSPAIRFAFAGKDALLLPAHAVGENDASLYSGGLQTCQTPLASKGTLLVDIDDFATPAPKSMKPPNALQVRAYHTSVSLEAPRKSPSHPPATAEEPATKKVTKAKAKSVPAKPSYAGFSDHDLQRQISAYGFKPVKKREKMVELLDMCWEDKYGTQKEEEQNLNVDGDQDIAALTHADFLGKVHDIAARPVPKVKKPRAKRKSESEKATTPKEPKKRKKAEPKAKGEPKVKAVKEKTPKKPSATAAKAKAKRKASELSEEYVLDIDDINEPATAATIAQVSEPPTEITAKKSRVVKASKRSKLLKTPTRTIRHEILSSQASEAFQEAQIPEHIDFILAPNEKPNQPVSPAQTPPLPDIQSQIRAAITFKPHSSSPSTNTITTSKSPKSKNKASSSSGIVPTWHEKILMYDPIVLEDLTAWLNTTGFQAINEDREVSALDVRDWCEANGVCCYGLGGGWRGTNTKK
ncbi:hypothetical protein LTR84_001957 [Exophiala bonariae]|uniref:Structure-specific endonuclease subunit SLX4 n=1 Tax=Exophiala bonariae TaxID=1690606 RepID=A0AAV9NBU0_9EURO|nr:hypothetical protein LTR84_001957 [Exophiala bonariae]